MGFSKRAFHSPKLGAASIFVRRNGANLWFYGEMVQFREVFKREEERTSRCHLAFCGHKDLLHSRNCLCDFLQK